MAAGLALLTESPPTQFRYVASLLAALPRPSTVGLMAFSPKIAPPERFCLRPARSLSRLLLSSSVRLRVRRCPRLSPGQAPHLAVTALRMARTVSRAMILPPMAAWIGMTKRWAGGDQLRRQFSMTR